MRSFIDARVVAPVEVLLLDLDETLYPRDNGVLKRIEDRIDAYMVERLGFSVHDVEPERVKLRQRHGTTMAGLMARFAIDVDDYLEHCHGVDLSDLLGPDPSLHELLSRLPCRKAVLTNAPRSHARQVLGLLGVADLVECVVSLEDLSYQPKPAASAYRAALTRLGANAQSCLFVDDVLGFAQAAARQGLHAAWKAPVGSRAPEDGTHVIHDLRELEPLLLRLASTADALSPT